MLFINRSNPQQATQTVKQQEASGYSTKPENPDAELAGSTWLTKDAAGFFSFGLVVVGVGQAVLFFFQLSYMRKGMDDAAIAANAAKESADTAKIQAEVARDTLRTMQDTAQRQLRAYLVVEPEIGVKNFEPGLFSSGAFYIRNVGQTPPHDVIMTTGLVVAPYPFPFDSVFIYQSMEELLALPNARRGFVPTSIRVEKDAEVLFSQETINAVIAGKLRLYLGGRVYYRDIFDDEWETDFLYMYYGPDTRTMAAQQCQFGNRAT